MILVLELRLSIVAKSGYDSNTNGDTEQLI
jgi:hypothetical protein